MNPLGPDVPLWPLGHHARLGVPIIPRRWDEVEAGRVVKDMLERLARACPPRWSCALLGENLKWAELEGQIEAAYLTKDIRALIRRCRDYEQFVLRCFEAWRRLAEVADVASSYVRESNQ